MQALRFGPAIVAVLLVACKAETPQTEGIAASCFLQTGNLCFTTAIEDFRVTIEKSSDQLHSPTYFVSGIQKDPYDASFDPSFAAIIVSSAAPNRELTESDVCDVASARQESCDPGSVRSAAWTFRTVVDEMPDFAIEHGIRIYLYQSDLLKDDFVASIAVPCVKASNGTIHCGRQLGTCFLSVASEGCDVARLYSE